MDKESTGMISWIDLSNNERIATLGHVSAQKGILLNAIEKDYWENIVLRALFKQQYDDAFVFKGGTSLSKGWGLIERFSEDTLPYAELISRLKELQQSFRNLDWE